VSCLNICRDGKAILSTKLLSGKHSNSRQEVIFSSNRITASHPQLAFNDHQINVEKSHLGFTLYEKLTFSEHVREAMVKAKHGIGIIHFLETYASRDTLDQMYVQTLY